MRFVMIAVLLAGLVACKSATVPVASPQMIEPPGPIRYEHVAAPSKIDVQREMEYRQLQEALDRAKQNIERFRAVSGYPPY